MATVTCPHCRTTGRRHTLLLHCVSWCGATEPFPVARLRRGRCPHGRAPQGRRSCPGCLRDLPRAYVEGPSRVIAVIGPAGGGKSTWVAAVVREFGTGELPRRFPGMSVDLLGEDSRVRYRRRFEPLLAGETAVAATGEPLLLGLPARTGSVVLTVYDTAGADFAGAERLGPYLRTVSGILLILDPQIGPLLGAPAADPVPFADIGHALRATCRVPARTPLAVVLSKVDLVWEMFDEGSPTRLPATHAGHYAESDGLDLHDEVRAWLNRWYAPALGVAAEFPVHRYFGLSALGAGGCPPAHRVADPLLWLLSRFGAVPTWRGRR